MHVYTASVYMSKVEYFMCSFLASKAGLVGVHDYLYHIGQPTKSDYV